MTYAKQNVIYKVYKDSKTRKLYTYNRPVWNPRTSQELWILLPSLGNTLILNGKQTKPKVLEVL